jgi:hypothetical protein
MKARMLLVGDKENGRKRRLQRKANKKKSG